MRSNGWRGVRFLSAIAAFIALILPSPAHAASLDTGWRLWPDTQATWQDDTLYLPSEVNLAKLPANAPTGGWTALNDRQGMAVSLPTTVEEHYWGKFGLRPYTRDVAAISTHDPAEKNGNYQGVSWWWRTVTTPTRKPGQRLILHIRGARLRTEVYCNGKLCGYNLLTELPFDADITDAVKAGQPAQIALRITSPGGILDWNDFVPEHFFTWGKYTFPTSHGFCGLDSGITLSVRNDVAVTDLAAINKPDLHTIHLLAEVSSRSAAYRGPVALQISPVAGGKPVWSTSVPVQLKAGETKTVEIDAHVSAAKPWDLQHPNLYRAKATLSSGAASAKTVDFGFRFFTAEGVKAVKDPILTLNGKRIVLRSAISWGYWGRNGLWPDEEMARREVTSAQALGLNCLQFHRNVGKPAVLDLQDRMGLLRDEEPGAGAAAWGNRYDVRKGATFDAKPGFEIAPDDVDTSGKGPDGDAAEWWEKYEEAKILAMVRRDRSHPSLIAYTIQNEGSGNDLRNPRVYRIFREMHKLDPSRILVAHSGSSAHKAQALMLPYSDIITHASQSDAWGGWHDQHTVGGPGNYTEALYESPDHFAQKPDYTGINDSTGAINMWGEMLGAGVPDNFARLVSSFDAKHPTGYDADDDRRVLAATHDFLDTWGFRKVFPTDNDYFTAAGNISYFFWQKVIEQDRAENSNDFLVISGWESTTIDNHSGIVDNHRFFKGDPAVLKRAGLPEMLVVRPRRFVQAKGQPGLIDVFLVNETGRYGQYGLVVRVRDGSGTIIARSSATVTVAGDNTYGQLLQAAIPFTPNAAGMARVEATLTPELGALGKGPLTRTESINVIDSAPAAPASLPHIAVLEPGQEIASTLSRQLKATPEPFHPLAASAGTSPDIIFLAAQDANPDWDAMAGGEKGVKGGGKTLDAALTKVKDDGARLVLWPNGENSARWMMQQLNNRQVVTLTDWAGHTGASWFGAWYFVRQHPLFDGLPEGMMDWRYGNASKPVREGGDRSSTGGAILAPRPGLEAVVGYATNDRKADLGISACVIPYGKGTIVWYCLPQLLAALTKDGLATNQTVAQRLLANAVFYKPTAK